MDIAELDVREGIMERKYTILAVDDAKDTLMLLDFDLSNEGYRVISVESGEEALAYLQHSISGEEVDTPSNKVDLILLDMYMPGLSGLKTLKHIKQTALTSAISVIMLSASSGEDEIVDALESGADDYVTKPYISKVLLARIRTSLRLSEKTRQLEALAKTDFLTGINNRGSFYDLSSKAISQCLRNEQTFVIAMMDIDYFKLVNDNYGHDAGDQVLIPFAHTLTTSFRNFDIIGRIGGEEFAVFMPYTSIEDAFTVCERFRRRIEGSLFSITHEYKDTLSITVSIGIANEVTNEQGYTFRNEKLIVDALLKTADTALYKAKAEGRNKTINANDIVHEPNDVIKSLYVDRKISVLHDTTSEVPSGNEEFPGIDSEVGIANVLGDKNLFKDILQMFYEDHHLDGDKLGRALSEEDFTGAKHITHTLKGISCSIGAMALFDASKTLDNAINNQEVNSYSSLFEKGVMIELNKVLVGISQTV